MTKEQKSISLADDLFQRFLQLPLEEQFVSVYFKTVAPGSSVSFEELKIAFEENPNIVHTIKNVTDKGFIRKDPQGRYFMDEEVFETIKQGIEKLESKQE